jgi:iron complex outermembrane receptor protein
MTLLIADLEGNQIMNLPVYAVLMAGTSLVASPPAMAQSNQPAVQQGASTPAAAALAAESTGDIIVTARRRAENIEKVPIAITVLGAETLKQKQITSEIDLQSAVPGLTIRQNGSANQFNFALRGQSVDTYSGSSPAILSYINDVQIVQLSSSTFYDLQGIQVLKGPQGTLFGRNSTGGAVLFETAKPTDKFGGYMIGRYGNHDSKYLEGAISIPLGEKAALRIAGNYTGGGAYVKNILNGQWLGKKDNKSIRATLVLKPLDGLTNTTVVQHSWEGGNNIPTEIYSVYPCGGPPVNGFTLNTTASCAYGPLDPAFNTFILNHPKLAPYAGGIDSFADLQRKLGPWLAAVEAPLFHRAKSTFVINTTNYEISPELTLKNIIGWNRTHADDGFDYDGTPYPILTIGGVLSADGTTMFNPKGFDQSTKQFSDEFQIQGKAFDNRLVYVIGAYFLNQTYNILTHVHAFDGIGAPANFVYQAQQMDHSRALFAQGTYKVTDQLSLTGGFRYSWDKLSQTTGLQSAYFPFFGAAGEKLKESKPSWTVSLDYQVTPSLLLYVTHRGSWRTGGFNYSVAPIPTTADHSGNVFLPETTKDVEVGLKYSGRDLGVPVTFNIDGYNQWISNVQRAGYVPGFGGGPGLVTVNVPSAEVTGFEADLSVRPAPWLTFGASGAYTHARYTKPDVLLFGVLNHYGPFADTPTWSGSAYLEATHELPGDGGTLIFHGDVFAETKFAFSNVANTFSPESTIKGYALVNARLSWVDLLGSKVSAAFYVRNLLNKKYYTGGNTSGATLGFNTSVGGAPRMFGGELRFDF